MSMSRTVKFCMGGTEKAQALMLDRVFQDKILGSEKEHRGAAGSGVAA